MIVTGLTSLIHNFRSLELSVEWSAWSGGEYIGLGRVGAGENNIINCIYNLCMAPRDTLMYMALFYT